MKQRNHTYSQPLSSSTRDHRRHIIFQHAATPYRCKMHNDGETEVGRSDIILANVPKDSDRIGL